MTDLGNREDTDVTERLRVAHETVEIRAPRWVLEILIGSAEAIADADDAPDDLRRDCRSAAEIAQSRLNQDTRDYSRNPE